MVAITLVCWTCGTEKAIVVPEEPRFGFQLAAYANKAEWQGHVDTGRNRVLVFCKDECVKAAMTKDGNFRAHPPKPAGAASNS